MNGNERVTRLRRERSGQDRYGNPIYSVIEAELPEMALFAPKDVIPAQEVGRSPVVVEPTLYWPDAWPDIRADDRLRVRGLEYEVEAIPAEWRGQTAGGLTVKLRDSSEGMP